MSTRSKKHVTETDAGSLDTLLKDVEARLRAVRRQNRTLSRAIGVLLVIAAAVVTMGATVPPREVVEAKCFVLVDGNGRERAVLGPSLDGGTCLTLQDTAEKARLVLGVGPDVLDEGGEAYLHLRDSRGLPKAELETVAGKPRLTFYSVQRIPQAGMWLTPAGAPLVFLNRTNGSPSMHLSLWDGSSPRLTLWDAPRWPKRVSRIRAALGIWRDGSCRFYLTDKDAEPRAVMRVDADGASSLDLFDKDGNVIRHEP